MYYPAKFALGVLIKVHQDKKPKQLWLTFRFPFQTALCCQVKGVGQLFSYVIHSHLRVQAKTVLIAIASWVEKNCQWWLKLSQKLPICQPVFGGDHLKLL